VANCNSQRTKVEAKVSSVGSPVSSEMLSASSMATEVINPSQQSRSYTPASEVEMTPPRAEKATSTTCSLTSANTTNMNKSILIIKLPTRIAKYLWPTKKMVFPTSPLRIQNNNHMMKKANRSFNFLLVL
jgi:hypothetical protein